MHLKHLLKSFGYTTPVAYSPKIVNSLVESPKNLGKAAEQERRLRLFMKLFCARQDVYAERWETYFWCFDDSFGYFCHIRLQKIYDVRGFQHGNPLFTGAGVNTNCIYD